MAKEPAAAPTSGSERRWWLARVLSLLLMAAALIIPWADRTSGIDVAYTTAVILSPLILVPGVAAFLLGGALLWSNRFSPRVSARLSRANIVALCLALLIGIVTSVWVIGATDGMAGPYWGGLVYLVGVATALVVEIRAFRTMRGNEPAAAPTAGSKRFWWLARLVSLLLMTAALFLPWTDNPHSGFQIAYRMAVSLSPFFLVPGLATLLLGAALLLSDRYSPRVSTGLSQANIVALCLALPFGLVAAKFARDLTGGVVEPYWLWHVYFVGVALAIVVEIRALRTMRGHD